MRVLHCLAGVAVLAAVARPSAAQSMAPAPAEPPRLEREIELSLHAGYGFGGDVDDSTINRYGPGVGARGGITLKKPRLYFGGSFLRFLGAEDESGKYYTVTADLHVGYDLRLLNERLLIRPEVAMGVAQTVAIQSDNAGYPLAPHLAPGLLVGLRLPPVLTFVEARRDSVPGDWSDSITVLVGAGAIF